MKLVGLKDHPPRGQYRGVMGKRQKAFGRRRRTLLLKELGDCCKKCGSKEKLEFDCILARGHEHHTYDAARRVSFYWQQHWQGNLQILCSQCNNLKAALERLLPNHIATEIFRATDINTVRASLQTSDPQFTTPAQHDSPVREGVNPF